MKELTLVVTANFNRIECDTWIDKRRRPDGDYDLIGMGSRTEYDAKTGVVVSNKTEPTGVTGWAPRDAIEPQRSAWWRRLLILLKQS